MRVALFEPRIPQNTGNIGRTCLAFSCSLDLIEPIGFSLEDKYLKRAGLDYWKHLDLSIHKNFESYLDYFRNSRIIGFSKSADCSITRFTFKKTDILLFGREDTGLPADVRLRLSKLLRIPININSDSLNSYKVRSLNLSVACGIAVYQASITI